MSSCLYIDKLYTRECLHARMEVYAHIKTHDWTSICLNICIFMRIILRKDENNQHYCKINECIYVCVCVRMYVRMHVSMCEEKDEQPPNLGVR
jgi:hypothetical protein